MKLPQSTKLGIFFSLCLWVFVVRWLTFYKWDSLCKRVVFQMWQKGGNYHLQYVSSLFTWNFNCELLKNKRKHYCYHTTLYATTFISSMTWHFILCGKFGILKIRWKPFRFWPGYTVNMTWLPASFNPISALCGAFTFYLFIQLSSVPFKIKLKAKMWIEIGWFVTTQ